MTSNARAAASHASAPGPRGVSTVIGSGQTGSAIIATRRQWLSRPCGRLIQMTVCSSGKYRDSVSLVINVLEQDEATGRYAPLIAVTCLVFCRSMEPHRQ